MVTLAAASWGAWSLFLRPTGLPATVTSPIIFLAIGLVPLLPALRDPTPARWDRRALGLLFAYGVFDALNVLTFFAAIERTTVAVAVLSHYLAPILIACLAPYIDRAPSRSAVPAAIVALVGLAIILEPWQAPAAGAAAGATLGAISAFFYAGNVFTIRRLVVQIGTLRATSYHAFISAAITAPLAIPHLGRIEAEDLGYLAAGGATIGGFAGAVFVAGLARIGAARTAVLTFAEPLVAVAIGALVWGGAPPRHRRARRRDGARRGHPRRQAAALAVGWASHMQRVTIAMPSYNEEHYIEACIASVKAQDYPADLIEILVADGRSTDRTREILARMSAEDPRIRMIDNPARLQAAGPRAAREGGHRRRDRADGRARRVRAGLRAEVRRDARAHRRGQRRRRAAREGEDAVPAGAVRGADEPARRRRREVPVGRGRGLRRHGVPRRVPAEGVRDRGPLGPGRGHERGRRAEPADPR